MKKITWFDKIDFLRGHHKWWEVVMGEKKIKTFNCHGSVCHAYNGTIPEENQWLLWENNWEKRYPGRVSCYDFTIDRILNAIEMERGDVVEYATGIGNDPSHSATMINPYWAWGSNNVVPTDDAKTVDIGYFTENLPEDYCYWSEIQRNKKNTGGDPIIVYIQIYRKP